MGRDQKGGSISIWGTRLELCTHSNWTPHHPRPLSPSRLNLVRIAWELKQHVWTGGTTSCLLFLYYIEAVLWSTLGGHWKARVSYTFLLESTRATNTNSSQPVLLRLWSACGLWLHFSIKTMICVNAKESYIWTHKDSETHHSLFHKTKKYWESVAVKQYMCQNKELRRKGSSGEQ